MNKSCFTWKWGISAFYVICISQSALSSVLNYNNYNNNNSRQLPNPTEIQNGIPSEDEPGYTLSPHGRYYRQSKFFPLFTIIRFTNEVCRTTSEEAGICFTKTQCSAAGGLPQGNCAQGLGVCCRFVTHCGAIVTQNGTSFQNPGYPSKYNPTDGASVCQVRIRRQLNVCQLRLNFINLDIDGPSGITPTPTGGTPTTVNDAGACKTDSLAITASGGTIPNLCGNMNGQHIYVDFGSSDTVTLNLLLSGNVHRERQWNIEILMIPCNSLARAPPGCLQYFQGISGQVQSFNFQGGQHLNNMDYSICVRPEDGMRFIDWMPCQPGDVRISGYGTATSPTMTGLCPSSTTVPASDYLNILGGIIYPAPTTGTPPQPTGVSVTDRFCDTAWPSAVASAYVRSSVRPFILHFKTDAGEVATANMDAMQGFCLRWQQNPQ